MQHEPKVWRGDNEPSNIVSPFEDVRFDHAVLGDIELCIGRRIRGRRRMLGVSQRYLASKVGVTAQQIHKYERGDSAVSAARLALIAAALASTVNYFYSGD